MRGLRTRVGEIGTRLAILVVPAAFAGAIWAQTPDVRTLVPATCKEPRQASRAFVENLNAAQAALTAKDWHGAIGGAALARPHAMAGEQLSAVTQIEIAAYHELRDETAMVERLAFAIADTCMPATIRKNYRQMMDSLSSDGTDKPEQ